MQKQNESSDAVMKALTIRINLRTMLDAKEAALMTPGLEIPLSVEEADALGAFEETAVSYEEARAATSDVKEVFDESKSE